MRMSRLGGGLSIALLICAACEVRTGPGAYQPSSGGGHGGGNNATAAKPPAPAPAPMPNAPTPTPNPNPTPVPTPHANGGNAPTAMHARQVPNLRRLAIRNVAPPPAVNSAQHTWDPGQLAKIRARAKNGCGPHEVAPGVIIHIDCVKAYTPMTRAKNVSALRRLNLFKQGRLKGDPGIGGGTPGGTKPMGDGAPQDLPATVDHRADGIEGPVKDQDRVGSCTGFSLSTAMDNAIRRLNKSDVSSSMHIWSHYAIPAMGAAGDSNLQKPIAVWNDWTYDPKLACRMYHGSSQFGCGEEFNPHVQQNSADNDPAVQAQIKAADAKGKYKIVAIDRIYAKPVDVDALAAQLASGKDIWSAFYIDGDAWGMRATSAGEIPDYGEGDSGHAVVIAGYRTKNGKKQFLIHNSWTERWADKGYAWISEDMVKQNLHDAYVLKVEDMNAPPPPPPPPPPKPNGDCANGFAKASTDIGEQCLKVCGSQGDCDSSSTCTDGGSNNQKICAANNPLTDDDCADDELVDLATNKCATMCANDTRPNNGVCSEATGGGLPPKKH